MRPNSDLFGSESHSHCEGDDKTSYKCSQELCTDRDLLGDALLAEGHIRGESGCNLAGTNAVEEADVLTKDCLKIAFSDPSRGRFTGVDPGRHVD